MTLLVLGLPYYLEQCLGQMLPRDCQAPREQPERSALLHLLIADDVLSLPDLSCSETPYVSSSYRLLIGLSWRAGPKRVRSVLAAGGTVTADSGYFTTSRTVSFCLHLGKREIWRRTTTGSKYSFALARTCMIRCIGGIYGPGINPRHPPPEGLERGRPRSFRGTYAQGVPGIAPVG